MGGVKKRSSETQAFKSVGKQMEADKMGTVTDTLERFKESLSEFAMKHKDRINSDPEFRMQFHAMCLAVGVDPLASSKGFWADILGFGDFYFELGVKVIHICVETRVNNGGLIPMEELLAKLKKHHGKDKASSTTEVTVLDIHKAVEKLSVLGGGFRIIKMASNAEFVVSLPMELNTDHEELLDDAENNEYIEEASFTAAHSWSKERFHMVLTPLVHESMLWLDEHNGQIRYMLPPSGD